MKNITILVLASIIKRSKTMKEFFFVSIHSTRNIAVRMNLGEFRAFEWLVKFIAL